MNQTQTILRAVGSLWFAAVLLVLLLVAMACATVVESMHGTQQALATFYHSWWFELLLVLVGINVLAAVLVRLPPTRRQTGFFITHMAILVTMGGALVTKHWGVNGHVAIAEGDTADRFSLDHHDVLIVRGPKDERFTMDLSGILPEEPRPAEFHNVTHRLDENTDLEIVRYTPDSTWERKITNDNLSPQSAVQVAFAPPGQEEPQWVFPGQSAVFDGIQVLFRRMESREELDRLVSPSATSRPASKGTVRLEYEGDTFEFPVEEGMNNPVPLGRTGFLARVVRYLPHATVGADNQVVNASDQPVNPYIEVQVMGAESTQTLRAFARFPEFAATHGSGQAGGFKLQFVAAHEEAPLAPVEVIEGPEGQMYVRLSPAEGQCVVRPLDVDQPIDSPWPGRTLTLLRRYDHARIDWSLTPIEPPRPDGTPAVLVRLSTPDGTASAWVQKYQPWPVSVGGNRYELSYADGSRAFGFDITLDRFHIGYYPGSMRPRSYESYVTVLQPDTELQESRVISMNHPAHFGGYTLYQSSYEQKQDKTTSILSVSRDPGQSIVFTGYIAMMFGMFVVLGTRVADYRRAGGAGSSARSSATERGRSSKRAPSGRKGRSDTGGGSRAGRSSPAPVKPPAAQPRPGESL